MSEFEDDQEVSVLPGERDEQHDAPILKRPPLPQIPMVVTKFVQYPWMRQPRNEPGHDVLIYSNKGRASALLLMYIYEMAERLRSKPQFGGQAVQPNER